jgi:transposase-like protein
MIYFMMEEKPTCRCQACESIDLIKKGYSGGGKQHYICKHCGPGGLVNASKARHGEAEKGQILNAYFE